MAKSTKTPVTPAFVASKKGKLRDPQATSKLSLKLAFARTARIKAA